MTYEQKRMIEKYRRKGVGYKQIAKDMAEETIFAVMLYNRTKKFLNVNSVVKKSFKSEGESISDLALMLAEDFGGIPILI